MEVEADLETSREIGTQSYSNRPELIVITTTVWTKANTRKNVVIKYDLLCDYYNGARLYSRRLE